MNEEMRRDVADRLSAILHRFRHISELEIHPEIVDFELEKTLDAIESLDAELLSLRAVTTGMNEDYGAEDSDILDYINDENRV